MVTGVVEFASFKANNAIAQRLTESEQSSGTVGEQMHLKVGIVSSISLKGMEKSAQVDRVEDHYFQLGENGHVRNIGVITPFDGQQLQSSQTVDGGDQITNQ